MNGSPRAAGHLHTLAAAAPETILDAKRAARNTRRWLMTERVDRHDMAATVIFGRPIAASDQSFFLSVTRTDSNVRHPLPSGLWSHEGDSNAAESRMATRRHAGDTA